MAKEQIKKSNSLSNGEKGWLIASVVAMVGPMPFTYVFFFLPLLAIPIAILTILVVLGIIRNSIAIRIIEVLSVLGAIGSLWILGGLINYLGAN